jgi:SAM-dependent methyltransferase
MSVDIAARWLPPAVANRLRALRAAQRLRRYETGARLPWSPGYIEYRFKTIGSTLDDPAMMERFRSGESLPEGYAVAVDERAIEYPWLLSRAPAGGLFLDAGSALNFGPILDRFLTPARSLHILTLAPEGECYWRRGISYIYDDLRRIPARSALYDAVACISTLEHVGCDNTYYTGGTHAPGSEDDYAVVVRELRRVLKPGGSLFLSVPFGRRQRYETFQQFDSALIENTVRAFEPAETDAVYYRYTAAGWNGSTSADCASAEYVGLANRSPERWAESRRPAEDSAAAARAVACLHLRKPWR